MKNTILLCLILLSFTRCNGQVNNNNTIVSSGNTIVMDGGSLDWIVGENLLDHQMLFGNNRPEDVFPKLVDSRFHIFPVITDGPVTLVSKEMDPENLHIEVYDIAEKLILLKEWKGTPMDIDLTDCTRGVYIILIRQQDQPPLASFKVVRE